MALLNRVKVGVNSAPAVGSYFSFSTTAEQGYRTFVAAGAVDGQSYPYVAEEGVMWEYGFGVYDATNNRISRLSVVSSAGDGVKENFTTGVKVCVDAMAEDLGGIGDILFSARISVPRHVRADGSTYVSSTYPIAAGIFPVVAGTVNLSSSAMPGSPTSAFKMRALISPLSLGGSISYAGVGGNGICMVSTSTTTPANVEYGYMGVTANFNGLGFNSGTYVAVGDGGRIRTSTDGLTWTAVTSPVSTRLNSVTYHPGGAGFWVAVGDGGVVLTAGPSATTWTQVTTGITDDLRGVATNNSATVVAVGANGRIYYSINSTSSWVSATASSNPTASLRCVVFTSSNIMYAGGDGGVILQSTGGAPATTTARTSGTTADLISLISVTSSNMIFGRSDGNFTTGSTTSWTTRTNTNTDPVMGVAASTSSNIMAVTATGVIVDSTSTTGPYNVRTGSTGLYTSHAAVNALGVTVVLNACMVLFAAAATPTDFNLVHRVNRVAGQRITELLSVAGTLVFVGDGNGSSAVFLRSSTDGVTWTDRPAIASYFITSDYLVGATYADGRLVVYGSNGRISHTTDFTTFASFTVSAAMPVAAQVNSMVYVEYLQRWVAATGSGYCVAFTRDLVSNISYTTGNSVSDNLVYGNQIVVGFNGSSSPYWSKDGGLTWTLGTGSYAITACQPAYLNGVFFYTSGTNFYYSVDGKSWNEVANASMGFSYSRSLVLAGPSNQYYQFSNHAQDYVEYYSTISPASPAQFRVPNASSVPIDGTFAYVRII